MISKLFPALGILVAVICLVVATTLYPGGFDWNKNYISTLLRGNEGPHRLVADAGVILFCLSIALIFDRLARTGLFAKYALVIRISGIGSMVYSCLVITPLHDLMVTISVVFLVVAATTLVLALLAHREFGFSVAGICCLALLAGSATVYYSGLLNSILPWAQRVTHAAFAVWLVALDFKFPRAHLSSANSS